MARTKTVRFASGTREAPWSSVWRFILSGDDVYIGSSKDSMGVLKISLHQSGVWVFAATQESGAVFEAGNRRGKKWTRPPEHSPGITRGPSIFVPHTSFGPRHLFEHELRKNVIWYDVPRESEVVEFSFYFVTKGAQERWQPSETVLAESLLRRGDKLTLLASKRPATNEFKKTVHNLLGNSIVEIGSAEAVSGSLLWMTDSQDELEVPVIVDLPVPYRVKRPGMISAQ